MNWAPAAAAAQTNISNFPFNEREIKNCTKYGKYGKIDPASALSKYV